MEFAVSRVYIKVCIDSVAGEWDEGLCYSALICAPWWQNYISVCVHADLAPELAMPPSLSQLLQSSNQKALQQC